MRCRCSNGERFLPVGPFRIRRHATAVGKERLALVRWRLIVKRKPSRNFMARHLKDRPSLAAATVAIITFGFNKTG